MKQSQTHRVILETALFAMFGALLFASKIAMEALPNIHPVTVLLMVFTLVYRKKAFVPVYVFVLLSGVYNGFQIWWLPYLYLWGSYVLVTLLLPTDLSRLPRWLSPFVYPAVCGLFGLLYGTLYAPGQAILFGYDFSTTLKWIAAGFPFDVLHGIGNFGLGFLILPLSRLLRRLNAKCGI